MVKHTILIFFYLSINDFKYFVDSFLHTSAAVNPALFLSSNGTNFSFTINSTTFKLSDLAAA